MGKRDRDEPPLEIKDQCNTTPVRFNRPVIITNSMYGSIQSTFTTAIDSTFIDLVACVTMDAKGCHFKRIQQDTVRNYTMKLFDCTVEDSLICDWPQIDTCRINKMHQKGIDGYIRNCKQVHTIMFAEKCRIENCQVREVVYMDTSCKNPATDALQYIKFSQWRQKRDDPGMYSIIDSTIERLKTIDGKFSAKNTHFALINLDRVGSKRPLVLILENCTVNKLEVHSGWECAVYLMGNSTVNESSEGIEFIKEPPVDPIEIRRELLANAAETRLSQMAQETVVN